ncbi:MAG: carbohydrate-binding domain-containing protein [Clostridia bacterium]|nr:carbohydrate-binding domain-containing protein [Clostridia bacterium]
MKRYIKYIAVIVSVILMAVTAAGCSVNKSNAGTQAAASSGKTSEVKTDAAQSDYFTERDLDPSYDEKEAKQFPSGSSGTAITEEGVYILSGSYEGGITVDAGESAKVQLVLNNAEITNSTGPAIYVKSADKVFITLPEGTANSLADSGGEYTQSGEKSIDGVIFADSDLTINGSGKLTVTAGYKHAVVSKKDLKITGGSYEITSAEKALEGENSIRICGGEFSIKAGDDALHADEENDKDKGFVYISGGSFRIESEDDGIHAVTVLTIDGGTFDITAHEALEATQVIINDGEISISASDDGINAAQKSELYDPKVEINGGNIKIVMGQGDTDAVDSNGSIAVNGGSLNITAQSAFDYETEGKINGGEVTVNGEKITEISNQFGGGMHGGQDGFGKREPMTDENGETLTRPDFKNFTNENGETLKRPERGERPPQAEGETPPEPPTGENPAPAEPGSESTTI